MTTDLYSCQQPVQPAHEFVVGQGSGLARHLLAASVNDERGDAADLKLLAGLAVRVGIEFGKADSRLQRRTGFFKNRRELFAGSTPSGPAIDDQGNVGTRNDFFDILIGQF